MIGNDDTSTCEGPHCDTWLTGRQSRFCSAACKMRVRRRENGTLPAEKDCVLCGAPFRPLRGKQVFCDYTGQADASCSEMQNIRAGLKRDLEDDRSDKMCEHCGEWARWDGVGRPRRFCAPRCKTAHYRAAKRADEPA